MNNFKQTTNLDLPIDLYQKIKDSIDNRTIIKSVMNYSKNNGTNFINRLIMRWFFKEGHFQVYRLAPELEKEILDFYQPFINIVGHVPKIRLKVTHDVRRLFPHTDALSDTGDRSSIVTVILGNNETTTWYNQGDKCRSTLWELLTMKKLDKISFNVGKSYLFNNAQVHGVTGCKPNGTRYLLAISWNTIDYKDLVNAYDNYTN